MIDYGNWGAGILHASWILKGLPKRKYWTVVSMENDGFSHKTIIATKLTAEILLNRRLPKKCFPFPWTAFEKREERTEIIERGKVEYCDRKNR